MTDAKAANTKRATLIVVGIAAAGLLTLVLVAAVGDFANQNKEVEMSKAVDEANRIDAKATADAAKGLDVPTVEGEVKESDEEGEPAPTTTATSGSGGSGGETGEGGDGEEEKSVKGKLKKGREKVSVLVRNRNFQIAAAVVGIIVLAAIVVGVLYQLQILKFGEDQLIQTPPTPKHDLPGATVDQTQNTYRNKVTILAGGAGIGLIFTGLIYAVISGRRWKAATDFNNWDDGDRIETPAGIKIRGIIGLVSFILFWAVPLTLYFTYSSRNIMLLGPMFVFGAGIAVALAGFLIVMDRVGSSLNPSRLRSFARWVFPDRIQQGIAGPSWHSGIGVLLLVIGAGIVALSLLMAPIIPGVVIPGVVIPGLQLP